MLVAKIAVSAATYWLDRPYDYLVPPELQSAALPGVRVYVPFSRGNRRSEGIILSITDHSEYDADKLKYLSAVLDREPILTREQIKLALFMRERFYCTVYDAVKAILPAGLWFDDEGRQKAKDKTIEMVRLAIPAEDARAIAESKKLRSVPQRNILDLLADFECLPSRELLHFTDSRRPSLKAVVDAGYAQLYRKEVYRRPEKAPEDISPLPVLNEEQQKAFQGINALAVSGESHAALLYGVTGSGKTSVYIHLIMSQLNRGRASILLVPEIALTPQMIHTFSSHFGDSVAVLHSSLSVGERYDEWKRVRSGKAKVVIGTRSAVFAPCEDLGLIIIDEEQEETYKSENSPRYHARDIAKYRCYRSDCLLLMGSATPDICSMYYARSGKYSLFTLNSRYNERALPAVAIVDMKRELKRGNGSDISTYLRKELEDNISRGEQSILFINRRGANKLIGCGECGYVYKCPRCSVSLTYHSVTNRLICHYCGYSRRPDPFCPDCGGRLYYSGAGTQMIQQELEELFPGTEILRMDTDSVMPAGSHEKLLERFKDENIPIMVGTQMVTKGLNFENVTLVGVISADQSLYTGDYRSGERTFSLITQVVGRSGRGEKPGRAVIQTYTPENETVIQAARQDYSGFFDSEIEMRRLQNTSPFADMTAITVSGLQEETVVSGGRFIRSWLEQSLKGKGLYTVLGPTPLPVVKVNNRYRYRVLLIGTADRAVRALVSDIVVSCSMDKRFKGVSFFADSEPMD